MTNYTTLSVTVHHDLKNMFKEACTSLDKTPTEVLVKYMLNTVREHKKRIRNENLVKEREYLL